MNFLLSFSFFRNTVATIPLAILIHDNFLSLYRIRGSSMEPTLSDGDVIVVRKADGLWQRWTRTWPPNVAVDTPKGRSIVDPFDSSSSCYAWAVERSHVLEYEKEHCRSSPRTGWLRTPPVPVTGNIVVFQDPEIYPSKWNIKRVNGLGGQIVLVNKDYYINASDSNTTTHRRMVWSMDESMTGMRVVTTSVPPFGIWVEGDNIAKSRDSRNEDHGPVSKKLLVGIAEYRIWPPWKVGPLDNSSQTLLLPRNDGDEESSSTKSITDSSNAMAGPRYRSRSYWPWRQV